MISDALNFSLCFAPTSLIKKEPLSFDTGEYNKTTWCVSVALPFNLQYKEKLNLKLKVFS